MRDYLKEITILYVEDEDGVREGYERTLSRYSKELYVGKDGVEGLELYKQYNPDVVVSDIKMPNKNGIEMVQQIKQLNPEQNVIFTTAHTETNYLLDALELQVEGYILKPVDKRKLKSKLLSIAKNIVNQRENIKNQQLLQNILDNQSSLTLVTNFNKIEYASASFLNMLGIENIDQFFERYGGLLGIFISHKDYIFASNKDEFLQIYYNTHNEKRVVSIAGVDGVKAFFISIDKIKGLRDIYVVNLTDITYLQEEKLKAQYKATHDELTGVYNRSKFDELFEIEYLRALRYSRPVSVAILDIDHFKNVNDTYGHLIGDEILKKMSKFCTKHIRQTDIFCRWGGEEFVLLMVETDTEQAFTVCDNLREGIEQMEFANLPKITVSMGYTQVSTGDAKGDIFKRADEALYEAKESGRNKVVGK
jgi:diguanylate cyclase (GGDEF)-like protein